MKPQLVFWSCFLLPRKTFQKFAEDFACNFEFSPINSKVERADISFSLFSAFFNSFPLNKALIFEPSTFTVGGKEIHLIPFKLFVCLVCHQNLSLTFCYSLKPIWCFYWYNFLEKFNILDGFWWLKTVIDFKNYCSQNWLWHHNAESLASKLKDRYVFLFVCVVILIP